MIGLPALPDIDSARLPQVYEAAKNALADCTRVDECQDWANRAEAMASYARQSEDETFFRYARRIKARAIDRLGELLREIPPAGGSRTDLRVGEIEPQAGDHPRLTREQAATEAGLSEHQRKTALRVNNVPRDQFEMMVESDKPPSIEQLADMGKKKREPPIVIDVLEGREPADFQQATRLLGLLRHIGEIGGQIDIEAAIRGLRDTEHARALNGTYVARLWIEKVLHGLQRKRP